MFYYAGLIEASARLHRGFQEPFVLLCKTHRGFFEAFKSHLFHRAKLIEASSKLSRTSCFTVRYSSRLPQGFERLSVVQCKTRRGVQGKTTAWYAQGNAHTPFRVRLPVGVPLRRIAHAWCNPARTPYSKCRSTLSHRLVHAVDACRCNSITLMGHG